MKIGLITDIHLRANPDGDVLADIARCIETFIDCGTDFMIQFGDLIERSENRHEEEQRLALKALRAYTGPVYRVVGNHCLAVLRRKLLASFGLQEAYYAFRRKGFRFVVLDGMDLSDCTEASDAQEPAALKCSMSRADMNEYCGAIGRRQMTLLDAELREADRRNEQAVVFCHLPPHPATTTEKYRLLWNHAETRTVLAAHPSVRACVSGHYHHGTHARVHGIHYLALKTFTGRPEQPRSAWSVAELQHERMVLTGGDPFLFEKRKYRSGIRTAPGVPER